MSRHKLRSAVDQWLHRVESAAEASPYVEYSAFTPNETTTLLSASSPTIFTVPTGMKAGLQQINSMFYPAPITDEAGVVWTLPVALTGNDMWIQWSLAGTFAGAAGDYIGGCVRMASGAETFYAFIFDVDDYELTKAVAGSYTVLKSGAITPVQGETWRLEITGTSIEVYRDEVLFESDTDSDIASGGLGFTGRGIDGDASVFDIRGGDLPVGNTAVWNTGYYLHFGAQDISNIVTADCGFSGPATIMTDGFISAAALHGVDHMHYVELDFGRFVVPKSFAVHGTTSDWYSWDDIDILTKVEVGDSWTEVATALTLDNQGVDGWKSSGDFSTITPCRYMRIEINSTANASNVCACEELKFLCVAVP